MSDRKSHWERVHAEKAPEERSWFQPRPECSLELIEAVGLDSGARVIDMGGGTTRLVDELLKRGFSDLTVLDISGAALEEARRRLGAQAENVRWIEADATEADLPGPYDLWHDRAVFHFLIEEADRRSYMERLHPNVTDGGFVIIATFAEDGPERCSGLPVRRYSPDLLARELGSDFGLLETRRESHTTPGGKEQRFVYCLFQKRGHGGRLPGHVSGNASGRE